ncbi:MAG: hypothetical protein CMJ59_06185 [Planctomycetaceae bacterium]|nr:hypothetical protein [Planctomycetaceae bacterium]
MQAQRGISFFSTGTVMALGLVLVAVAGVLCWVAWRRSGYRRATGMLELLRFVLICLVVATLNQPEWLETRPPSQRPTLAVLWDQSNSMETRDVIAAEDDAEDTKSRAETIEPLMSEAIWKSADKEFDVVFEPFSSQLEPPKEATDLNAGLSQVLENHSNLRGVVVLSDGDWNVGKSPVEAATRFRMKGIPVFAVGVGSKVRLPDLELASMSAPTFAVAGKPLRIPFVVRNSLGQDRDVGVVLDVNGEPEVTNVVRVAAMGQTQQTVVWTPPGIGDYTLTLRVPRDPQERVVDNNQISAPITVRQEQLRVLVIEAYPRWEYRYLRNALERDPGVEVNCLLFHPELPKAGGGRAYIKEFPATNELSRFDVVVLGDVGVGPRQLTLEQTQDLKQLVSAQAAGLVLIPGRAGRHDSLMSGPLADLYPVVLDPARAHGIGSPARGHFALTEAGQRSLLTRLEQTDQANVDVWRNLPGFNWYAGVQRAKVGAEILAVHEQEATASGRVPLIVTKTYGTGKVLFMGIDSAWRWREGIEDRYHYRFWGQVARWMAYQRQMAEGQSMRLFFSPDRPRVDDVVTLNANVLDGLGGPLDQGSVVVQAISPSGKTQTIRLQPGEQDAWGLFVGSLVPKEPGNYRLVASSTETGSSVQTDLSVQGLNRERTGRLARFDVLDEIAQITEAKLVPITEVRSLLDHLATLPDPEPTIHRVRIWSHPLWAGILILLLGLFWTGRKMVGAM